MGTSTREITVAMSSSNLDISGVVGQNTSSDTPGESSELMTLPELSFTSSPTGREVLLARAQEVIEAYNTAVEQQEGAVEEVRKMVLDQAELLIARFVENMENKRSLMNKEMQSMINEINQELSDLGPQEEELLNFSSGLGLLMKEMK